ncbi:Protein wos2 like protein [Verticillium longisporum]|uniref:Protein wos2 like protein n=3 Tax=Verticillium longisporum TaxID=100787 RepID=A0A8I2ZEL2_VERLO|nr:Protein wos2 like protein [Verticillium longisporum]
MSATKATPEVLWAQRSSASDATKNFVYLTISVPDVPASSLKLDLKPTGLTFDGHSDTLKKDFHLDLELYGEIDTEESKVNHTGKNIELKLQKKELKEEYWPRLLKESKKVHFLKTNFDKWVDEDEQEEAPEEDFSQFGGMGGMPGMGGMEGMGGMPGMGGMGGMGGMPGMGGGDFGGIDFSKLGAGGLGGADFGGDDDDEGDDDEDDMPALEGDEAASKPAAAAAATTDAAAAKEPAK